MIEVSNISKSFGALQAVDDISFKVEKGEVLGFLGPNGAGKSTTMKIITGFLAPDQGQVKVGGFDVQSQSVAARGVLGYVPENAPLYGDMTVEAFLAFVGEARGLGGKALQDAIGRVQALCSIGNVLPQVIDTLSKGYRRRVGLAQALLHDPPYLILDEPTDGLDPNQKHDVRDMISKMAKKKAIIISTHILEEVDAICSRAIIISEGKVLDDGKPGQLAAKGQGRLDQYFRQITTKKTRGASA